MTIDEAMEVLYTMEEMYPKFKLTERKAKILVPNLKKMNFRKVMENLGEHVMHHPYPPQLSEIAAYEEEEVEEEEESPLAEIERWKEEAKKVTPEMKLEFQEQLEQLLREKGWN